MATTMSAFLSDLSALLQAKDITAFVLADEAHKLRATLMRAAKLAYSTEEKEIQDADSRFWISKLRDLAYDAEDAIDCYGLEAAARKARASKPIFHRMRNMFRDRSEYQQLKHRMKSLSQKINGTLRNNPSLGKNITESGSSGSPTVVAPHSDNDAPRDNTTHQDYIAGSVREEVTKFINKMKMTAADNSEMNTTTNVMAIVGLGGVGKTTMARMIYDDERTVSAFSVRLWVCVSKDFTDTGLLSCIISAAGETITHGGGVETRAQLQRMLARMMRGKRFLLVLDDVWSGGIYEDVLKSGLHSAAGGSRVLVTARSELVATQMGAQPQHIHHVVPLTQDHALSLLHQKACAHGGDHNSHGRPGYAENDRRIVEDCGGCTAEKTIVEDCGGLPLAIRIMGSILQTQPASIAADAWEKVRDSGKGFLEEIPEGGESVTRSICLAYVHLRPHLKQCFLYCCSLFPAGSTVRRRSITELWISEGLVQRQSPEQDHRPKPEHAHDLNVKADEYYMELVSCNLLQPQTGRHDAEECTVHSLVQLFARHLTADEIFAGDLKQTEGFSTGIRRLSVANRGLTAIPEEVDRLTSLRTFLLSGNPIGDHGLAQLFRKLKLLRVLDLSATAVEHIPDTIGDLRFMRHLNLSKTKITMLPDSLKFLMNLELLDLKDCGNLHSLPEGIQDLYNLRYLDLEGTALEKFPQNLQNLERLRVLHGFVVDNANSCQSNQTGWPLAQLKSMKNLTSLQLLKIERATEDEAKEILVNIKDTIKELKLCCSTSSDNDEENVSKVFTNLCRPEAELLHVKSLEIKCYQGKRSPDWLSSSSCLPRLQRLVIEECKSIDSLPNLNQLPELRFLTIVSCEKLRELKLTRQGGTGTMEELYLKNMPELCSLLMPDGNQLQSLRVIRLEMCPKITSLPDKLERAPKLARMEIIGADALSEIKINPALEVLFVQDAPQLNAIKVELDAPQLTNPVVPEEVLVQDAPRQPEISPVPPSPLKLLIVIGCKKLASVEVEASHIRFQDGEMTELPEWVTKHTSKLESLRIVGTEELLDDCYSDGNLHSKLAKVEVHGYLKEGITPFFYKQSGSRGPQRHHTIEEVHTSESSNDISSMSRSMSPPRSHPGQPSAAHDLHKLMSLDSLFLLLTLFIPSVIAWLVYRDPYVVDTLDDPLEKQDLLVSLLVIIFLSVSVAYWTRDDRAVRIYRLLVDGTRVGVHRMARRFKKNWMVAKLRHMVQRINFGVLEKFIEDLDSADVIRVIFHSCSVVITLFSIGINVSANKVIDNVSANKVIDWVAFSHLANMNIAILIMVAYLKRIRRRPRTSS